MKRKVLSLLLVAALCITSFAGCGKNETPTTNDTKEANEAKPTTEQKATPVPTKAEEKKEEEEVKPVEPTTLTMWIMPNSGTPEEDLKTVLQPFLDENPDIKVEITLLDWGSAWTKITTAATSGVGPDITQLGTTQVAAVAAMDALENLSPVYDMFGGEGAFVEASLPTTQILGMGEERYAVPWFIDTRALFYRKDMCEAAGVNPETDFADWDSFTAALEKLKAAKFDGKDIIPLGMPGKNDWNVIHNYAPWIWGAGGDFIADDNTTSIINTDEAFEGVKYYSELAIKGLMHMPSLEKNSSEIESLFNNGEFACIFTGAYNISTLRRDQPELAKNIGTAMFPAGPKGRYCFFGGSDLCVFKTSKNKEAAYRVIQYLSTAEQQIAYQNYCGNLPTNAKAYETSFIADEPMRQAFKDQLQYGKAYPSVAGWGPSETLLQTGLSNVWDNIMGVFGEYSPERTKEYLDATANECTTVYSAN